MKKSYNFSTGGWNYHLKAVYTIGILDFIFDKQLPEDNKKQENSIVKTVKLSDINTKEVFYDKLTFVYIEVPKFNVKLEDLNTHFEKWLYAFRYLHRLQKRPENYRKRSLIKFLKQRKLLNSLKKNMWNTKAVKILARL